MLYCGKCKTLTDKNKCCGKVPREPKENDPVYLTSTDSVFSGMLEDILKKNGIPYINQGMLVPALAAIMVQAGEHKFYVPFGAYEKANRLLREYFDGEGEIQE